MKLKLLIVEDDLDLQKVLRNFLQTEGYLTDTADTGASALKKINEPKLVGKWDRSESSRQSPTSLS